jgi:Predicted AAA-ATPase
MKPLPQLPLGRQYFKSVRKGDTIYVDKTKYIYDLCHIEEGYYFLSRPRRFGKSLTLDTIAELFQGNKTLFEGLWIADKWDWSVKHAVIRLSLDAIGHTDGIFAALQTALHKIAATHKVKLTEITPGQLFQQLIQKVARKSRKPVVVLIDEYDRPIVDYIDPYNYQKSIEHRDILKEFFSILKDASKDIRCLFITGVTKFARVSIFSTLNHLTDLTLNPHYAALCGYTQSELEHSFAPYLETMPPGTLSQLKQWYDGYSWDGKTFLYNPFSILNFFDTGVFSSYWFQTGTPGFLVRLLSQRFEYQLEEKEVSDLILESFILEEKENLDLDSLLLQTGYLTIKEIVQTNQYRTFILKHPNEEVRQAFNQFLLSEYAI